MISNDLENAALRAVPAVAEWREALDSAGAGHFRLSGSGASFFGLHPSLEDAEATLERIREAARRRNLSHRGDWVSRPARTGARLIPAASANPSIPTFRTARSGKVRE